MFTTFEEILEAFGVYLIETSKNNKKHTYESYIPKLREGIAIYLREKQKKDTRGIDDILKTFHTTDLAESAIIYIQNTYESKGTVKNATLDNYIISVKRLFEFLATQNIDNNDIMKFFALKSLKNQKANEFHDNIIFKLKQLNIFFDEFEREAPLSEETFNFLIETIKKEKWMNFDLTKSQSCYKLQYIIMIKLFLLLGMKPQKIYDIKTSDFDELHCQLCINGSTNKESKYYINLPNELSDQLMLLKKYKRSHNDTNVDNLFSKIDGKPVNERHMHFYLKKIKENFINTNRKSIEVSYTQTSIMRYGIVQMILSGIEPVVLYDVTGIDAETYEYCQKIALPEMDKSRHFASKIRGIPTYDVL